MAGSANVSGTMPCFLRLVSWIRAKLRAIATRPSRKRGSIAACSRLEPSPMFSSPITTHGWPASWYALAMSGKLAISPVSWFLP